MISLGRCSIFSSNTNKKGRHSAIKVASYQPQLPREYELSMKVGCLLELLTFILLVRSMESLFFHWGRIDSYIQGLLWPWLRVSVGYFDRKGVSRKIFRGGEKSPKNSKKVRKIALLNLFQGGGNRKNMEN